MTGSVVLLYLKGYDLCVSCDLGRNGFFRLLFQCLFQGTIIIDIPVETNVNRSLPLVRFTDPLHLYSDIINGVTIWLADFPNRCPAGVSNGGLVETGEGKEKLKYPIIVYLSS